MKLFPFCSFFLKDDQVDEILFDEHWPRRSQIDKSFLEIDEIMNKKINFLNIIFA